MKDNLEKGWYKWLPIPARKGENQSGLDASVKALTVGRHPCHEHWRLGSWYRCAAGHRIAQTYAVSRRQVVVNHRVVGGMCKPQACTSSDPFAALTFLKTAARL